MNDYDKFFFDLNGYVVVEDALTPREVSACNEAIDHERDRPDGGRRYPMHGGNPG